MTTRLAANPGCCLVDPAVFTRGGAAALNRVCVATRGVALARCRLSNYAARWP